MTQEKIIEGNRLIAEFMGWQKHINTEDTWWFPNLYPFYNDGHGETTYHITEARFHESWDWLMPVVEKIEDLDLGLPDVLITGHVCIITNNLYDLRIDIPGDSKLDATWQAIVKFIEWLNSEQGAEVSDTTKMPSEPEAG